MLNLWIYSREKISFFNYEKHWLDKRNVIFMCWLMIPIMYRIGEVLEFYFCIILNTCTEFYIFLKCYHCQVISFEVEEKNRWRWLLNYIHFEGELSVFEYIMKHQSVNMTTTCLSIPFISTHLPHESNQPTSLIIHSVCTLPMVRFFLDIFCWGGGSSPTGKGLIAIIMH